MTFTLNNGLIRLSFVVLTILLWVGIHSVFFTPSHNSDDAVLYWTGWILAACMMPLVVAVGAGVVLVIGWVIEGFMKP